MDDVHCRVRAYSVDSRPARGRAAISASAAAGPRGAARCPLRRCPGSSCSRSCAKAATSSTSATLPPIRACLKGGRVVRCGQNVMNARSEAQPICRYWQDSRQRRRAFWPQPEGTGRSEADRRAGKARRLARTDKKLIEPQIKCPQMQPQFAPVPATAQNTQWLQSRELDYRLYQGASRWRERIMSVRMPTAKIASAST